MPCTKDTGPGSVNEQKLRDKELMMSEWRSLVRHRSLLSGAVLVAATALFRKDLGQHPDRKGLEALYKRETRTHVKLEEGK